MNLQGSRGQQVSLPLYRADITMTGSAQLVLAKSMSRSSLILQNLGTHAMAIEIGGARAHAVLTNGVVTSVVVDNGGFGYLKPPVVKFLGGGPTGGAPGGIGYNSSYQGLNQPNGPTPSNFATGIAVLSAGGVASVTVNNGGANYVVAPYVYLESSDLDPYGCATPAVASSGMGLPASQAVPIAWNGTTAITDAVSVIGTAGDVLFCGWTE